MHFAPKTASCRVIFFSLCQYQFNVRRQQTGKGSGLQSLTKQRFSTRRKLQIYNGNAAPSPNRPYAQSRHGCVHNFYTRSKSGQARGISAPQLPRSSPPSFFLLCATPKLQRRKIAMHWGLAAQWGWGRGGGTDDRTSCKSLKASVWTCVFCILQARHGLPHSAKCSSNQRCSSCVAQTSSPAPLSDRCPRLVLRHVLLQRFMHFFSVCDNVCCFRSKTSATVLSLATPQTQQNMPQCRATFNCLSNLPSFSFSHRREAKNCQA